MLKGGACDVFAPFPPAVVDEDLIDQVIQDFDFWFALDCAGDQAGAAAGFGAIGASRIGRLTAAATTASAMSAYHIDW